MIEYLPVIWQRRSQQTQEETATLYQEMRSQLEALKLGQVSLQSEFNAKKRQFADETDENFHGILSSRLVVEAHDALIDSKEQVRVPSESSE